jgi:hypothetical protein
VATSIPYTNQIPTASCLDAQDLPLLWASLIAFREAIPPEETQMHAQIDRVIIALEHEQARRHESDSPSARFIQFDVSRPVSIEQPDGRPPAV